jgi:S-adenosyl-L-methionine hydrolase (adenosine-forming)
MQRPGILTLTTDFGNDGPYVAAMKGVVLGLAPGTQLVDVSHTIAPQNILEGAFVLGEIVGAYPEGTVHLVVVDPGVGTDRRLIAA